MISRHPHYYCIAWLLLSWISRSLAFTGSFRHSQRHRIHRRQRPQFMAPSSYQEKPKFNVTICLVDHYDSYTFNIYDMIASLCAEPPIVIAKDAVPPHDSFDGICLSPGPGRPPHDTGISISLIENNPTIPILGVCLGHQALGYAYGANITEAPTPIHGQVHPIHVRNGGVLWENVQSPLHVVRYHSLVVQEWNGTDVPLKATAWYINEKSTSNDNIVMGLEHRENPHYGVQFHPESIGTEQGMILIKNFLQVCQDVKMKKQQQQQLLVGESNQPNDMPPTTSSFTEPSLTNGQSRAPPPLVTRTLIRQEILKKTLALHIRRVSADASPLDVFTRLYQHDLFAAWLDSSNANSQQSRFSIMASMNGPLSRRIEYLSKEQLVLVEHANGRQETHAEMDILSFLDQDLESFHVANDKHELPFDYRGGYIGFLGYEVRHDTQRYLQQLEHGQEQGDKSQTFRDNDSKTPTASFLFADQSLVYDHVKHEWYLVGLSSTSDKDGGDSSILSWMNHVENVLLNMKPTLSPTHDMKRPRLPYKNPLSFVPNRSPQQYRHNIASCHEQIRLGESYELCLTNQIETRVSERQDHSPLELYKLLRQCNPVPFAAFLSFQRGSLPVSVCCSSPERFVSVKKQSPSDYNGEGLMLNREKNDSLHVEAKPIKGTCAREIVMDRPRTRDEKQEDERRAHNLEASIKNRAENLMIVDLLRNDLNRVCQTGSVHVPKLMEIESYTTVHQMVSTIRGLLREDMDAIDVLRACFPGGSMTGAPKLRSMEILHELEEGVSRGPYSGCLGYISLNGSMDMNIVIRSAVLTHEDDDWRVRIGAGGAITALSESEDEYEEMLLKARAVVEAVQAWSDGGQQTTAVRSTPVSNMTLPAS